MNILIKKTHPDAIIPQYQTDGAACFDLHSVSLATNIYPDSAETIGTGLSFEIPPDHVMLVFSRSGHGFKNDVRLSNCVGIIDSDFRGEVMVKLRNDQPLEIGFGSLGEEAMDIKYLRVNPFDRIAQAMIIEARKVKLVEVNELTHTARGTGGFGSTG